MMDRTGRTVGDHPGRCRIGAWAERRAGPSVLPGKTLRTHPDSPVTKAVADWGMANHAPITHSEPGSARTVDHRRIRQWADDRKGRPVAVKYAGTDPTATLRFEFGDRRVDPDVDELTWTDFFERFEDLRLAFVHERRGPAGERGEFHKFVPRD